MRFIRFFCLKTVRIILSPPAAGKENPDFCNRLNNFFSFPKKLSENMLLQGIKEFY